MFNFGSPSTQVINRLISSQSTPPTLKQNISRQSVTFSLQAIRFSGESILALTQHSGIQQVIKATKNIQAFLLNVKWPIMVSSGVNFFFNLVGLTLLWKTFFMLDGSSFLLPEKKSAAVWGCILSRISSSGISTVS
eukprot:NODE_226_length_12301_cov_1.446648.p8 type:complete len:136 gc:universal NODE_226_length_12301_cov_1.446648:8471-8064(-)